MPDLSMQIKKVGGARSTPPTFCVHSHTSLEELAPVMYTYTLKITAAIFFQEGIVENVSNDLQQIWESGKYHYQFPPSLEEQCKLVLIFSRYTKEKDEKQMIIEWDSEQIRDFVQKLGFLQNKDERRTADHFCELTKVCLKQVCLFQTCTNIAKI